MKHKKRALIQSLVMLVFSLALLTTATFAWFTRDTQRGPLLGFVRTGEDAVRVQGGPVLERTTVVGRVQDGGYIVYPSPAPGSTVPSAITWTAPGDVHPVGEGSGRREFVHFKTRVHNPYTDRNISLYLQSVTRDIYIGVISTHGKDYRRWQGTAVNPIANVPIVRNVRIPAGATEDIEWFIEADDLQTGTLNLGPLWVTNN